ncbi:hypothetical protein ACFQ10_24605 [Streptomyces indonesiensis]
MVVGRVVAAGWSSGSFWARIPSRIRDHWATTRSRRCRSSVSRLARPRPRPMSSRPWTASRTPGTDSSAPSSSTAIRCVSRPIFASSALTRAPSCSSYEAATHSWRAARKSGPV